MPDNANPQAIKFANEKARVFADALLSAIETARSFKNEYEARTLDTIYPATADNIADGSEIDGRSRVSNNAIRALYAASVDILTWAATGSPTRESRLRAMAVNGLGRF